MQYLLFKSVTSCQKTFSCSLAQTPQLFVHEMEYLPKLSVSSEASCPGLTPYGSRRSSTFRRKSSVYLHRASLMFNQVRKESVVVVLTFWQSFRGVILSIAAAFLFSMSDVMVKSLSDINPSLIAFFRFGGMGLFSLAAITEVTGDKIIMPKSGWIWAICRGVNGAVSLYLYYVALHLLPLANVRSQI